MKVKLVVRGGKLAGKEIPVRTPQFVIGRDESCNLRPASNMVSKLHCALVTADEALWARDLKSTNGTFVNGAKIDDRVQLKHGDEIRVGPLALEVHIADERKPVAAQTPSTKAKSKPSRKSIDDDDVCDWLTEEEVESSEADGLSETPTILDLALNADTVPEMHETQPPAPAEPKRNPRPAPQPASSDSSSAANKLLQNFFVRKRSSG